jgi:hypothetical protein
VANARRRCGVPAPCGSAHLEAETIDFNGLSVHDGVERHGNLRGNGAKRRPVHHAEPRGATEGKTEQGGKSGGGSSSACQSRQFESCSASKPNSRCLSPCLLLRGSLWPSVVILLPVKTQTDHGLLQPLGSRFRCGRSPRTTHSICTLQIRHRPRSDCESTRHNRPNTPE